jgi:hypothetical protein
MRVLPSFLRSTTRMSWPGAPRAALPGGFGQLARLSLLLPLLGMSNACLVDDPPQYTEPKQTPPRLNLREAVPLVDDVLVRTTGKQVLFNVPVASEDAGDGLFAVLRLNFSGEAEPRNITFASFPPSTLDDTTRSISLTWTIDSMVPSGCNRITLEVTHLNNVSFVDKHDLAVAVWWANINPSPDDPNSLSNCPVASREGM